MNRWWLSQPGKRWAKESGLVQITCIDHTGERQAIAYVTQALLEDRRGLAGVLRACRRAYRTFRSPSST